MDKPPVSFGVLLSLPEEVKSIANLEHALDLQIEEHEEMLIAIREKVKTVEDETDQIIKEITCMKRKLITIEEETLQRNKQIIAGERDLFNLDQDIARIKQDRAEKIIKMKSEKRGFLLFENDMTEFQKKVINIREDQEEYKSIAQLKSEIEDLLLQKQELDTFDYEMNSRKQSQQTEKEIQILNGKNLITENEVMTRERKLAMEKEKLLQSEKELSVFQKRNTAQLLRLKRQQQEAQTINNQWKKKIFELRQELANLQKK